jgi:hypothetical protein
MTPPGHRQRLLVAAVGLGLALLAVLAGCGQDPAPPPTASPPSAAPSPTAPSRAAAPSPSPRSTEPSPATSATPEPVAGGRPGDPGRVVVTAASGRVLVDAAVRPLGLDHQGVLAPPQGLVGWYDEPGWPRPGDPGAAILAGHVGTPSTGPDTFSRLPEARPGDRVTVSYGSGRAERFVVVRSAGLPKEQTPQDDSIWDAGNPRPLLRLITCDPSTPLRTGHYLGNWVLWAEPA